MSSLNADLSYLFDCKPQTLTWTVDYNSQDTFYRSPNFGENNKFLLHLFKDSQIMYNEEMYSEFVNIQKVGFCNSNYPFILLNCTDYIFRSISAFGRISILNETGDKCNTQEGRVNFDGNVLSVSPISGGVYHFNFEDHLINGKLTIFCELYVLDERNSTGFNADSLIAVSNDQKALLESGKYSDVVIAVDGKEFKAHKLVLMSRSAVFAAMFEHTDTKEALEGRVELEDVQSEVFEQFLKFLYTGKVSLLDQFAAELLELADKYDIPSLKSLCSQHLSSTLSADSVQNLLRLADMYNCDKLKSNCVRFIKKFATQIDLNVLKNKIEDCSAQFAIELLKLVNVKK